MEKKTVLIFSVLLAIVQVAYTQTKLVDQMTDAKRRIVIAAVEFLATDVTTFPNAKSDLCRDCNGYQQIKDFVKSNQLTGVTKLVDQWRDDRLRTSPGEAKASLASFAKSVEKSLITGGRRPERKSLASYQTFLARLKDIQNDVQFPQGHTAENDGIIANNELKSQSKKSVRTKGQGNNPDDKTQQSAIFRTQGENSNEASDSTLSGIPVNYWIMGAEALVIVFQLVLLYLKLQARDHEILELKRDYRQHKDIKRSLENALLASKNLQQELVISENRTQELEELLEKAQAVPATESASGGVSAPAQHEEDISPAIATMSVLYARYADAGDGFSVADLLPEEDGETIFVITLLTTAQAEFHVSKNQAAQRYALANANYFLSKVCKYDTSPAGTIITDTPGTLILKGNKWQLNEPAKISFTSY